MWMRLSKEKMILSHFLKIVTCSSASFWKSQKVLELHGGVLVTSKFILCKFALQITPNNLMLGWKLSALSITSFSCSAIWLCSLKKVLITRTVSFRWPKFPGCCFTFKVWINSGVFAPECSSPWFLNNSLKRFYYSFATRISDGEQVFSPLICVEKIWKRRLRNTYKSWLVHNFTLVLIKQ